MRQDRLPEDPDERAVHAQRSQEKLQTALIKLARSTPLSQAERGGKLPGAKWERARWEESKAAWIQEAKGLGVDITNEIAAADRYMVEKNMFVD